MGKASRRKREQRPRPVYADRPRWAGAPGFDRSYFIADLYASTRDRLREAQATGDRYGEAKAQIDICNFDLDLIRRKVATLETACKRRGIDVGAPQDFRRYSAPWTCGRPS